MKATVLLTLALLTLVDFAAAAQPQKMHRIGFLSSAASPDLTRPNHQAFLHGLRDLGYVEGKSIVIEYGPTDRKLESVEDRVAHMVRSNVSLIVVVGTTTITTVLKSVKSIPIVMIEAGDPVRLGFVKSLASPGGNATGLSSPGDGISAKRMELLKETLPKIARVVILNADLRYRSDEYAQVANDLGVQWHSVHVNSSEELLGVFPQIIKTRPDALIIVRNFLTLRHTKQIAEFALTNRLPTMFGSSDSVRMGGLLSYGVNYRAQWRRAAVFVDKILKGAAPAALPIEPTRLELAVNLATAGNLSIKIPPEILLEANEVVK